jgi:hypothetical protein
MSTVSGELKKVRYAILLFQDILYSFDFFTFSASEELPEAVIIRDLVYAFQGIEGRWIRFDPTKEGYRINPKVSVKAIELIPRSLSRL